MYYEPTDDFIVIGIDEGRALDYRFLVDGTVEPAQDVESELATEIHGNDTIQEADGFTEVIGHTGNGYGDAYTIDGYIVLFERLSGESAIQLLDGEKDVTDDVPRELMTEITVEYRDGMYVITVPENQIDMDPDNPSLTEEQEDALSSFSRVAKRIKSAFSL